MLLTVVLEKTLESPLDCKEIKPVNPIVNLSWIFFGRTNAEAEAPTLWPSDGKNWLIGKDLDAGKGWRQGEGNDRPWDDSVASSTRWTRIWANSRSWWRTGRLVCCSLWGCKESDLTTWTEVNTMIPHNRNSYLEFGRLFKRKQINFTSVKLGWKTMPLIIAQCIYTLKKNLEAVKGSRFMWFKFSYCLLEMWILV